MEKPLILWDMRSSCSITKKECSNGRQRHNPIYTIHADHLITLLNGRIVIHLLKNMELGKSQKEF
jgi:hypothetical protein